jgi:hypothetical protein
VRHFFEFFDGKTAAVSRTDQRAHTGSGDDADWNSFFFEDLQDSDVSHTAGKTAAQRHPDRR